eukprot:1301821-Pleurochrysis_carterae.AAC.1
MPVTRHGKRAKRYFNVWKSSQSELQPVTSARDHMSLIQRINHKLNNCRSQLERRVGAAGAHCGRGRSAAARRRRARAGVDAFVESNPECFKKPTIPRRTVRESQIPRLFM